MFYTLTTEDVNVYILEISLVNPPTKYWLGTVDQVDNDVVIKLIKKLNDKRSVYLKVKVDGLYVLWSNPTDGLPELHEEKEYSYPPCCDKIGTLDSTDLKFKLPLEGKVFQGDILPERNPEAEKYKLRITELIKKQQEKNSETTKDWEKILDDIKKVKEPKVINYKLIKGWICPVCGKGLSPFTSSCPCIQQVNWPYFPQPLTPSWELPVTISSGDCSTLLGQNTALSASTVVRTGPVPNTPFTYTVSVTKNKQQ